VANKIAMLGRTGPGDDHVAVLLRNATGFVMRRTGKFSIDSGVSRGVMRLLSDISRRITKSPSSRVPRSRMAARVRSHVIPAGTGGLLGQMLFSGEDATKRTENLSGGEAARLVFAD